MENVCNCSVCSCEFDEYAEGGTVGYFGMLPVAFCPTCLSCMFDMVEQLTKDNGLEVA
jgi:peroxiredoxin